ncbi:MAG: hypothetical protein ACRC1W_00270 [Shewanella sp.]
MNQFKQLYELSIVSDSDKEFTALSDIFSLYDVRGKGQQAEIKRLCDELAKAKFLGTIRAENEVKLKASIEEQAYSLAVLKTALDQALSAQPVAVAPAVVDEPQLTSFERCQLETKIARLESSLAAQQRQSDIEMTEANNRVEAIEAELKDAVELVDARNVQIAYLSAENESLVSERGTVSLLLQDQIENVLNLRRELGSNDELINALKVDSQRLEVVKEERKQALAAKVIADKKLAQFERKNEVLEREAAKFKTHRHESRQSIETAKRAFDEMVKCNDEFSNELVRERMERRYLTMMIDSLNNSDVLELRGGFLSLYSFSPERVLKIGDAENASIDTEFPLGLWTNHLGVCCIVAVSQEFNESGERDLIMPKVSGLSQRGHQIICPSKTECSQIVVELMKYNAKACNEAIARCRAINSEIARCTNFDENRVLTNKRLIAVSREKTSTGLSVTTNRPTVSRKRKGK